MRYKMVSNKVLFVVVHNDLLMTTASISNFKLHIVKRVCFGRGCDSARETL